MSAPYHHSSLCSFKFYSLEEKSEKKKSKTDDETSEWFWGRVCKCFFFSFSVTNFCLLFVLFLHESFIENKVHSAKSNSSQQFCAETLRDTSKNPKKKAYPPKCQRPRRATCPWERYYFLKGNLKHLFQLTCDWRTLIISPCHSLQFKGTTGVLESGEAILFLTADKNESAQ